MAEWRSQFRDTLALLPSPDLSAAAWQVQSDGSVLSQGRAILGGNFAAIGSVTPAALMQAASQAVLPTLSNLGVAIPTTFAPAAGAVIGVVGGLLGAIFGGGPPPISPKIGDFSVRELQDAWRRRRFDSINMAVLSGRLVSGERVSSKDTNIDLAASQASVFLQDAWQDGLDEIARGKRPSTGWRRFCFFAAATKFELLESWTPKKRYPELAAVYAYGAPRYTLRLAMAYAAFYDWLPAAVRHASDAGFGIVPRELGVAMRDENRDLVVARIAALLFPLPSADLTKPPPPMPTPAIVDDEQAEYDKAGYGPSNPLILRAGAIPGDPEMKMPVGGWAPLRTPAQMIDRAYEIALTKTAGREIVRVWKEAMRERNAALAEERAAAVRRLTGAFERMAAKKRVAKTLATMKRLRAARMAALKPPSSGGAGIGIAAAVGLAFKFLPR